MEMLDYIKLRLENQIDNLKKLIDDEIISTINIKILKENNKEN